jgi:hypothetical protein
MRNLAVLVVLGACSKNLSVEQLWGGDCSGDFMLFASKGRLPEEKPMTRVTLDGAWLSVSHRWNVEKDASLPAGNQRIELDACGFTSVTAAQYTKAAIVGDKLRIDIDRQLFTQTRGAHSAKFDVTLHGRKQDVVLTFEGLDGMLSRTLFNIATTPLPEAIAPDRAPRPRPLAVFREKRFDRRYMGADDSIANVPYVVFIDDIEMSEGACQYDQGMVGRYRRAIDVKAYETRTGKVVKETSLVGAPSPPCPTSVFITTRDGVREGDKIMADARLDADLDVQLKRWVTALRND